MTPSTQCKERSEHYVITGHNSIWWVMQRHLWTVQQILWCLAWCKGLSITSRLIRAASHSQITAYDIMLRHPGEKCILHAFWKGNNAWETKAEIACLHCRSVMFKTELQESIVIKRLHFSSVCKCLQNNIRSLLIPSLDVRVIRFNHIFFYPTSFTQLPWCIIFVCYKYSISKVYKCLCHFPPPK